MAVINKISKVMNRDRVLVSFDQSRIVRALARAAASIGGFERDYLPAINGRIFDSCKTGGPGTATDETIADFLSDLVVTCLNANPYHLVSNFPPNVEQIQDVVLHVLRSYGFTITADAYESFRWGNHWVRQKAITPQQFVRNGYPSAHIEKIEQWNRDHHCLTIADLNEITRSGKIKELIDAGLAAYEASLDEGVARVIARINGGDKIKLIWISGPSSSGKTTTTVKLAERLRCHGLEFLMLNLDDYFLPLITHPTDWIDDRNYETPEALDIQLINEHLLRLLAGERVAKPIYSFTEGRRIGTEEVKLERDQILLLDCLHGFYPPINKGIDSYSIFRLYIEAMNVLYENDGNSKEANKRKMTRFEDIRLLRRTLRDAKYRNHSPLSTFLHWHYVRAGELSSIIPLKGLADIIINGGMPFDLPVLQPFFAGNSRYWPKQEDFTQYRTFLDAYIRYERLGSLLQSVEGLPMTQIQDHRLIPGDALLREFIGGNTIKIPHNE
ncbi:hypothetical protein LM599_02800 [Candidatus Acetothermia bacterium]|jgi:uridine kinase|nr:hypothetical protein [Candidatus Acetothermia bacterium]MCI2427526.1 hypothetical protein [Candidatus Acetothermia bacterium]